MGSRPTSPRGADLRGGDLRAGDVRAGARDPLGLERRFAIVVGIALMLLGLAGSIGNPIVGRPDSTGIIVTGFGHDLVHLVSGALFLHVGIALNGRDRAVGLAGLGAFLLLTGILSLLSLDLLGLYDAPASGLDQLGHLVLGTIAIGVGWAGRGVERREYGRSASRALREP